MFVVRWRMHEYEYVVRARSLSHSVPFVVIVVIPFRFVFRFPEHSVSRFGLIPSSSSSRSFVVLRIPSPAHPRSSPHPYSLFCVLLYAFSCWRSPARTLASYPDCHWLTAVSSESGAVH